jgi:hypothetical protein
MFRCDVTGKLTAPGEPCKKVIVETRKRVYEREVRDPETGARTILTSTGWEIVKEINVSPEGIEILALKAKGVQ